MAAEIQNDQKNDHISHKMTKKTHNDQKTQSDQLNIQNDQKKNTKWPQRYKITQK